MGFTPHPYQIQILINNIEWKWDTWHVVKNCTSRGDLFNNKSKKIKKGLLSSFDFEQRWQKLKIKSEKLSSKISGNFSLDQGGTHIEKPL